MADSPGLVIPIAKRTMNFSEIDLLDFVNNEITRARIRTKNAMTGYQNNTDMANVTETFAKRAVPFPLARYPDSSFYLKVYIGETLFTMSVDTGTNNIIVPSGACANCGGRTRYIGNQARLLREEEVEIDMVEWPFKVYADTVRLQPIHSQQSRISIAVVDQIFGAAKAYPLSYSTQYFHPDGIFGLGRGAQSSFGESFIARVAAASQRGINGIVLVKLAETAISGPRIVFGNPHKTGLYEGPMNYVPIPTHSETWALPLTGVIVDGRALALGTTKSGRFETSYAVGIIASRAAIDAICDHNLGFRADPTGQFYFMPCGLQISIFLRFGSLELEVPIQSLNLGEVPIAPHDAPCHVALYVGGPIFEDEWIIGASVIQNFIMVLDRPNQRIGFAKPL